MRVRFGELSQSEVVVRERVRERAREAWQSLRDGDVRRAQRLMNGIDERVTLWLRDSDGHDVTGSAGRDVRVAELTLSEASAAPLAELLLAAAPDDVGCALSFGRAASSLERALSGAREEQRVELERATFRAGFSRGH